MSLTPGTRLGSYEVIAPLGAGGMGEVYRAKDTKLNRDVAIKVLPESFALDADRVARFTREAQVLASLNHPNIAAIYGIEEQGSTRALVMELVEGEDLSAVIARGAVPLADALPIARQIADALEAAHEQGIVHRDLKPQNVKLKADGAVKVLDFGLAKAIDPASSSSADAMNSPTMTARATQMGMIIGTAAYMSPEQARGRAVDRRADIWAFGVVLYEMLTGRRAFEGDDISDVLAAVLRHDIDFSALPTSTPSRLRALLARCLDRDLKTRLRDIGEARILIDKIITGAPDDVVAPAPAAAVVRPIWRRAVPVVATAVIASVLTGGLFWMTVPAAPPAAVVTRFSIGLPVDHAVRRSWGMVAVSPDGTRVVFAANRQLYVRDMGSTEATAIPGTNVDPVVPFFSPDGQWVGFGNGLMLQKISITGGSPITLCKNTPVQGAISWYGGSILFSTAAGVSRVSEDGGEPELLVKASGSEAFDSPQMLDDGRLMFVMATKTTADRWDTADVVVQTLATGARRVVMHNAGAARFVASKPASTPRGSGAARRQGHLIYAVDNVLRAVPFDPDRLEVLGNAVPVVDQVARSASNNGTAQYDISRNGVLAYIRGGSRISDATQPKTLVFVDRIGTAEPLPLPPQAYIHPRVSPSGRQIVYAIDDGMSSDVWVYDLATGGNPRRLTFAGRNLFPIWSHDGRYVAYQSDREGDKAIFRQLADGSGTAERLTKPAAGEEHEPESFTADDTALSVNLVKRDDQSIWLFPIGPGGAPRVIVGSPAVEKHSTFSPDGRWIAYMSTDRALGGNSDVYVQPFPTTGARYQVSNGSMGRTPAWSADSKHLFFHSYNTNHFFEVDVRPGPGFSVSAPVQLPIDGTVHPLQQRNYDVTPDGKRLLVVRAARAERADAQAASPQITVVLNWFEELVTRVPVKK